MCSARAGEIVWSMVPGRLTLIRRAVRALAVVPMVWCGSASAAAWLPDQATVGNGVTPGLAAQRTTALSDGTTTSLAEDVGPGATLTTHVFTRPAGGQFTLTDTFDGGFASIVGDPDGGVAVVTYEKVDPNHPETSEVFVRVRRPGGQFDAKTQIGTGLAGIRPAFIARDGTFWAIEAPPGSTEVRLVRRAPGGTVKRNLLYTRLADETLSSTGLLPLPDGSARIMINTRRAWQDDAHGKCVLDTAIHTNTISPDGIVAPDLQLEGERATSDKGPAECNAQIPTYADAGGVQILPAVMAVGPDGETSLIYGGEGMRGPGQTPVGAVIRVYVPLGGSWNDAKFEQVLDGVQQPTSMVYAGQDIMVSLFGLAGGPLLLQRVNGSWTAPVQLSAKVGTFGNLVGAPDGTGMAAVWTIPVGGTPQVDKITAFLRRPDGRLDPARTISQAAVFSDLWTDNIGDFGVTSWTAPDPAHPDVFVTSNTVYDGAPPKVTVTGPAGGLAGQATSGFTATATDIWSAPAAPAWAFSGGGDATGSPVSHIFGTTGRQTATAKVADAAGNEASGTTALDVAAAPVTGASPPPPAPPVKDTTKPALTKLKVSFDRRMRVATLRFALSEDATVKLTVKARGRKRPTTITKKLKKGARFMKTRRLRTHLRYMFSLQATDAAKNRSKLSSLSRSFR